MRGHNNDYTLDESFYRIHTRIFARYFAMPVTTGIVMLKPNRLLILMATLSCSSIWF